MNARLTLRVPEDVREALEKKAKEEDLTLSQVVRRMVRAEQGRSRKRRVAS